MRLLMLFTIGFCLSTGICAYVLWNDPVVCFLLAAACLCLCLSCYFMGKRPTRILAVCFLGMCLGNLWYGCYDTLRLRSARDMDQVEAQAVIYVTDYSYPTDRGVAADGETRIDSKTYKLRFYLQDTVQLKPGDRVEGRFLYRFTSSGGQEGETFHRGNGIFLLAYAQENIHVVPGNENQLKYLPARLRRSSLQIVSAVFPEDTRGFAAALLLGEDSGLTYAQNTDLKLSGIRHVVAVSGQHLLILMAAVMFLTGKRRRITCYLSFPVCLLFSAMAGFSPSIVRACIMQMMLSASFLAKREYDGPTSLSAAVLLMVLINPLAITSVSLLLSVASVGGMMQFSPKIYDRIMGSRFYGCISRFFLLYRIFRWTAITFSVTLSSMVVTVPLSALYFKTVSIISIVTNLATLWLISAVFYGVIAAVVLGALYLPAGSLLGGILSYPIRYVLTAAGFLADIPMGCIFLRNPYICLAVGAAYIVLVIYLLSKRSSALPACCYMAAFLLIGLALSWKQPLNDNFRVTVLDVGQGQCILLQSGSRTYMVDCGGDYPEGVADTAAETLLSMGINRIDGLILTHYDNDHAGAAPYLMQRIQVDTLILPEENQDSPLVQMVPGSAVIVSRDMAVSWEGGSITIFAANGGNNGNEMSLCVLFQSGNCDILITGDRPMEQEVNLLCHAPIPQLEFLIAGHHGADSSTGNVLLESTRPHTVIISVGAGNGYGHPGQQLLERLRQYGCMVRRTDLEGTIIIRG